MLVVHVHVQVKPESVDAFKQASLANALESLKEPGIVRFDVVQQQALPGLARCGRAHDGRAADEYEIRKRVSRGKPMVSFRIHLEPAA
jgi:hypothetical protein